MSRPIDAEVLMQAMYHRAFETDEDTMWQSGCWVRYRAIEQTVKEQPTIEPERKSGTWILQDGGKATCPFCQHTFRDVWDDDSCDGFCRRCGAMLEGAEQE